jgi:hypothetical protein
MVLVLGDVCAAGAATRGSAAEARIASTLHRRPAVLPPNERLCVRFPAQGPEAIVIVKDRGSVARAARLLRLSGVSGSVEVHNAKQYSSDVERIVEAVSESVPEPLRTRVHVGVGVTVGRFSCVRARIELVTRAEVTSEESEWAAGQVSRYGSDRAYVTYRTNVGR